MRAQARYVGIDCGESQHVLVALDAHGAQVWTSSVENRRGSVRRTLQGVVEEVGAEAQVHVVLESLYGFSSVVAEVARDLCLVIQQVNSKALDHYRDLEGQPHKDDERDAYLLARMAWLGLKGCRVALSPTPDEQALRRLGRIRGRVIEQRKLAKLRLRSVFLELCPGVVSASWEGPTWSSQSLLAVLERWPGFAGLGRARVPTIQRVLEKAVHRNAGKLKAQARALQGFGREFPALVDREIFTLDLSCLVADIRATNRHLKTINEQIKLRVLADPVAKKLAEMPGIGLPTAAVLTGELRPLARTSREAKVAAYAGLTPLSRKSGKSDRAKLAKGINKHAQQACYMSALASLKFSALDRAYYDKQRNSHQGHPKIHVVALLALARQRLKVIYKLMTSDQVYDKEVLISSHLARQQRAAA